MYPAQIRSTAHGISAATGKVGSICVVVWLNYLGNRNKFWITWPVALLGAVICWVFVADLTGLDLAEQVCKAFGAVQMCTQFACCYCFFGSVEFNCTIRFDSCVQILVIEFLSKFLLAIMVMYQASMQPVCAFDCGRHLCCWDCRSEGGSSSGMAVPRTTMAQLCTGAICLVLSVTCSGCTVSTTQLLTCSRDARLGWLGHHTTPL